ncbi:MAG: ergothioneine biosynthesis protein EgtB [Acidimicrobiia bacterium]
MTLAAAPGTDRDSLASSYEVVRALTETLATPLSPEDQQVQSMPDVSPTKWHRAHTTWFFETFVLEPDAPGYRTFDPRFRFLFNSYYEAVGRRQARPERGLVTRPGAAEVAAYRAYVDDAVHDLVESGTGDPAVVDRVVLGLHHEQQHQELLLMDIKHVLSRNAFDPAYTPEPATDPTEPTATEPASTATDPTEPASTEPASTPRPSRPNGWVDVEGGLVEIGHDPHDTRSFVFDNETPRHAVVLHPFRLADRPVTTEEWLAFIADDGYRRPELWLSDGWAKAQAAGWDAPLYWRRDDDDWTVFTLHGRRPIRLDEPVVHVSHYEADAYARWAGARLPTEFEWEHAAAGQPVAGHFLGALGTAARPLHPEPTGPGPGLRQLYGGVWEWTQSAYLPYPRFRPASGAIGEYNGKFMSNQMVLRGGACVTPAGHLRATYRNFFPPSARWLFGGVRLATDG